MRRLLKSATTLTTLGKIASILLCCAVLMVFTAPAQTIQQIKADPGNNNAPPAGAILDLASPPTPIPGGGTYQPYTVEFTASLTNTAITFAFRDDPAFVSFANASVTDVTNPSGNLLANGDFSSGISGWTYANTYGATFGGFAASGSTDCYGFSSCWYDGAVQAYDAISQTILTTVGDTYQITFSVAENSGCTCNFSDLSTNGDVTDTGGNGRNVTVYAQGGLPVATQTGQPINTNNPASFTQSFVQNPGTGEQVAYTFDFSTAFNAGDLTFTQDLVPYIGFNGITPLQWKVLVAGTALADTSCLTALGLTDSNGNSLCVVNTLTATTPANPIPSGANLPQSSARNILLTQTLDLDPNQGTPVVGGNLNIPANAAPGMAEFNDSGECPFASGDPLFGQECPRSIMTSIQDGPTKPGGTPKPAGSSQIFFCCEREWTTGATIPLWNNTTSIPVKFASTPPGPGANGFQPAPPLGVLFGAVQQSAPPLDPAFPNYPGQQTSTSNPPTACPSSPDWGTTPPPPFYSGGTLTQFDNGGTATSLVEGSYKLLYALQDCDEFLALAYPSSINITNEVPNPTNLAAWPTVPFNVDLTKPTVSPITLNPPGGYYAQGATVTASFTCTDPVSNGVASGIASCGPNSGGGALSVPVNNAQVSTSTLGPNTFTASATDVAGNSATPQSVPYQVVGNADLRIGMLGNLVVKAGQTITYLIGVANGGPSTAYEVVVNDTLPTGTSFVSAGYAIDSCTFGSGPPSCSILPPTSSCGNTQGVCNIGSLPAWTKKNPIGVLVQITVKVNTNVKPNTTLKNAAMVSGATNADPNSKNNTATWPTLVLK